MTEIAVLRWLGLGLPVAVLLVSWRRPSSRLAGAALLSFLTAFVTIGAVNQLAIAVGWWRFGVADGLFMGVPFDLWLGWSLMWGPIPLLLLRRLPIWAVLLGAGWFDLLVMPRLHGLLELRNDWLYGELLALLGALLPTLLLGRWTVDRRYLNARVTLQLATFAGLTLWLLPTYAMSQGDGRWSYLVDGPVWRTSLILQLIALAAVPAVASVVEFAVRGRGTPYPCDPPSELVTTGPFAYVANPMQVSVVLVLGLLAVGTHSWSLAVATVGSVAFSEFVAEPHERGELPGRFGAEWEAYSSQVRRWVVRRTPYRAGTAELYLAESCVICRQTRALVESTGPQGLTLQAAEGHAGSLQRALYLGPDGLEAWGLAAVARGLEHSGLGWAYLGWLLRLPVLRPLVQLLLDGMGGGPRQLQVSPDQASP